MFSGTLTPLGYPGITSSGKEIKIISNICSCWDCRSVEASLERLQTPYIDLLYTHVRDDGTPLEETLETLGWLVQQGEISI